MAFSYFDICHLFGSGKYQNKEKPLKRQRKLGLHKVLSLYKYNILERVLVENIIPRNVIINRGAAEVDNHISRDDVFD